MPTFEVDILNIVILFGALQGFLLTFILITTKRLRKKSNFFLAILVLTLSLLNLSSAIEFLPQRDLYPVIGYLPFFWVTLIPPTTYLFIKFLIEPKEPWINKYFLLFIPFVIEFSHRSYIFIRFLFGHELTGDDRMRCYFIFNIYETFACLAAVVVIISSIKKLDLYEQKLYENYAEVEDRSLRWLRITLTTGLALTFMWVIVAFSDFGWFEFSRTLAIFTLIGLSIMIYWIGYSMIIRQGLLDTPIFAIGNDTANNGPSELSIKTDEHYERMLRIVEEEELYKNVNLNMSILSDRTGLSNGYLSQIINQKRGQNFFDFINGYRIEAVKKNMADPSFDHYTLLGIAQEAGFKSKSTFNAVFKKTTGLTPSGYKKTL